MKMMKNGFLYLLCGVLLLQQPAGCLPPVWQAQTDDSTAPRTTAKAECAT